MKVTIYGTGYVGLVTGTCLAGIGHEVLCVDIDKSKIAKLQAGEIPIYEPGLIELVQSNSKTGSLRFSDDVDAGIEFSDAQIITVNTPTLENKGADISNILTVANSIAEKMQHYKLVINKSTAPPGTVNKIKQTITNRLSALNKNCEFDVASNPEFLKEGAAIQDFMQPDRIIVGSDSAKAKTLFSELYSAFTDKLIFMDIASAELSKYTANAMLATKISFMNEIANIAEKVGADIEQVKHAISLDPRIGPHFINPGCGYGGSCFPKDVKALAHFAQEFGIEPVLLNSVEQVNFRQKKLLAQKILEYFNYNLQNKIIGLWGLAFKPNTDDMREASSITLLHMLWQNGAVVKAYDPIAMEEAAKLFAREIAAERLILVESKEAALESSNALAIVTEWPEFKAIDLALLKDKVVFDGRNLYAPKSIKNFTTKYFSIGRPE